MTPMWKRGNGEKAKSKLWVFHEMVSLFNQRWCQGFSEVDARDIIPLNGLPLCGKQFKWALIGRGLGVNGDDPVQIHDKVYIPQPKMNRLVVFLPSNLHVIQMDLLIHLQESLSFDSLFDWIQVGSCCHGQPLSASVKNKKTNRDLFWVVKDASLNTGTKICGRSRVSIGCLLRKNRRDTIEKTIEVVRIGDSFKYFTLGMWKNKCFTYNQLDGHLIYVYDLFCPHPSLFRNKTLP